MLTKRIFWPPTKTTSKCGTYLRLNAPRLFRFSRINRNKLKQVMLPFLVPRSTSLATIACSCTRLAMAISIFATSENVRISQKSRLIKWRHPRIFRPVLIQAIIITFPIVPALNSWPTRTKSFRETIWRLKFGIFAQISPSFQPTWMTTWNETCRNYRVRTPLTMNFLFLLVQMVST